MTASMGAQSKTGIGTTNTVTVGYEVMSNTLARHASHIASAGIRGTRQHTAERVAVGPYTISGSTVHNPTPLELDGLLPFIMGGSKDANTNIIAFAETLPDAYIAVNKIAVHNSTAWVLYNNCKAARATFRGATGQPLEVSIDWEGLTETLDLAAPTLTYKTDGIYVVSQGVFTLGGTAYPVNEFELTIDNGAVTDRFYNLSTHARSDIPLTDHVVTFRTNIPWSSTDSQSTVAVYDETDANIAGQAATLVFSGTSIALTFSMPLLQLVASSPVVNGRGEITLPLQGQARAKTVATAADTLTITNDSTV